MSRDELDQFLYFTDYEKIKFLEKRKFLIKRTKIEESFPIYHNDTEVSEIEVIGVYKLDGKPYHKPHNNFANEYWLNSVFYSELKNKLLEI